MSDFGTISVNEVIVDRPVRQRKALDPQHIASLAESISRNGLINPITLDNDNILIAGECRLEAHKLLHLSTIKFQRFNDLSDFQKKSIELEENVKRKDLTWQEECLALEELHSLYTSTEDDWSQERTAQVIGYSQVEVSRKLAVANELISGNETIAKAERLSIAQNMVARSNERKRASQLADIKPVLAATIGETAPATTIDPSPIINTDFHKFQESFDAVPFNLIHCDFPYGINVADAPRQNSTIKDYYKDSPDIYWSLLERLSLAMDNIVAESAHLIFWFDMGYYAQTYEALTSMGWNVTRHPLIWHKTDSAGIAPDPQRTPRRTYETAFFAHRGDRKLTESGVRSNSFGHPGRRGDNSHVSEKPLPMLKHFMSMICDEYSTVFDPTCGSANSLKAARALGASSYLGLELDEQFYQDACRRWNDDEVFTSTL